MTTIWNYLELVGGHWLPYFGLFLVALGIYKFAKDYLPW